jgi:hypothetical protein
MVRDEAAEGQGIAFGSRWMVWYPVHGQFQRERLLGLFANVKSPYLKEGACDVVNGQVKLSQAGVCQGELNNILPRKTGLFKIAQFGPTFSLLPNNQDQYVSRLRQSFGASTHEKSIWLSSASAYQPDVPLQITDCVDVAKTVRDSDRVLEAGKDAN